jgi:tetratricopeptide (TPR) repeat protein
MVQADRTRDIELQQKLSNEGEHLLQQASEQDLQQADGHRLLGNALSNRGCIDGAIASFNKALAVDPDDAVIHCNLGTALAKRGSIDDAIAAFRYIDSSTTNSTHESNLQFDYDSLLSLPLTLTDGPLTSILSLHSPTATWAVSSATEGTSTVQCFH